MYVELLPFESGTPWALQHAVMQRPQFNTPGKPWASTFAMTGIAQGGTTSTRKGPVCDISACGPGLGGLVPTRVYRRLKRQGDARASNNDMDATHGRFRKHMSTVETPGCFLVYRAQWFGECQRGQGDRCCGCGCHDGLPTAVIGGGHISVVNQVNEYYDAGERSWVTYGLGLARRLISNLATGTRERVVR